MNPVVISYETEAAPDAHPGLRRFRRSLAKWGWPLVLVHEMYWGGFGRKLKACAEAAATARGAGHSHAIFCDSYDVVFVGPPSALVESHPPLLLATEAACWPPCPVREAEHPECDTPWRFAHSQLLVDLRRLELLDLGGVADGDDDQRHLMDVYLRHLRASRAEPALRQIQEATPLECQVGLDTRQEVFCSIAHSHPWFERYAVGDDRVVNKLTKTRPVMVHGNGRTDMSWVPGGGE